MTSHAPKPVNEAERVAYLHALAVLDTAAEPLFDALTRAAATVIGVPIALVSLIDSDRQWFKSNLGLSGTTETSRDLAFCAHAILGDGLMEVPDAQLDARFEHNPLVTGGPRIRFYAGAPITLGNDLRLGTLCVIDQQPRVLSDTQRQVLRELARAAALALEQRALALQHGVAMQREAEAGQRLAHIVESTQAATAQWHAQTGERHLNPTWAQQMGRTVAELQPSSSQPWLQHLHPEDLPRVQAVFEQHLRGEISVVDVEARIHHRDGYWVWVHDRVRVASRSDDGRAAWLFGARMDISTRKQAKLALVASELRTRKLYDTTPAMLQSVDPEGRLLSVSDVWLRRLGYAREEVIGRPLTDFLTADSAPRVAALIPEVFRSGHCERKAFQMLGKDASVIDIELSSIIEFSEQGQPLRSMAVLEDVTSRRFAEARLLASEALLERAGQLAGVGAWEVNLDSNTVYWSDETCRLHDMPAGYQPTVEEAINFYAPAARPRIQEAVSKAMVDGIPWDLELPLVSATGRQFWGRALGSVEFKDGRPWKLVGAFQDITFRRRAIESLETSERRARKLFQYSLGLICTHDLDGILLSVNPAAVRSLGYSLPELMGRKLSDLMKPEYHAGFAAYLQRIASVGSDAGSLRLQAKDGSSRVWYYQNVLDQEGDEPYVLGHAQDITERERQVQQLRDWSIRDALTGCYNRRYLADVTAAMKEDESWGCIAVDLDHFKQVNDTYGHHRGDEVLVAMGGYLQRHVRPSDAVVRAGGDEFLLLLKDADETLLHSVVARLYAGRAQAPIGFTLGASMRGPGMTLESALQQADKRLYEQRSLREAAG